MNETQQELLDFIYKHKLNAEDTFRFVRDYDVSQEDKQAVLDSYQKTQQEQFELQQEEQRKQELARQTQLQADIDQGLVDLKKAREQYEAASDMLDETGLFDFLGRETAFATPGTSWMSALSPQRQFEAAKAAQAKAATELQQNFYKAGREDLADMIGLPKSKFSRRAYTQVTSGVKGMLYDIAGSIPETWVGDSFADYADKQSDFYRDVKQGVGMEQQKTAGELVDDMGDAIVNMDLDAILSTMPELAEESGMLLADQAPYLALTFIPGAGVPLNFIARTSQAYRDVEDNPNYTDSEKALHAFVAGGIESFGDNIIGKTGNWLAGKAVSKIGSKLMSNAILRGTTKVAGVTFGEGTTEALQELAIMGSEKYILGEDFTAKDVKNRMYEGFVGGVLVGGPLSGARSVASKIAQPSPSQIASRPGDPSHPLAVEIAEKIDSIIEQSENVEPNSPEAKALESELEGLLEQERQRVNKSRDYYRKMRRRDRKSYDRILELDDLIGRAIMRSKGLKSDWAKDSSKKEIESLMEERNKLYQGFDEKSKSPLTTLEQFQDAVEDIDVAIAEIDSDLEAIYGLSPENDNDFKLVHDMAARKSALKNKKKDLQKALGELQRAEDSGNVDNVAEAYRKLQVTIDRRIPSTDASIDQTNDDIDQDQAEFGPQEAPEAQVQEQPEAEPTPEAQEETPVEDQPTQETEAQEVVEEQQAPETQPAEKQPLTFTADDNITDAEIDKLPTQLVRPIRNLLRGLKLPVTVRVHENVDDLRQAHPKKSKTSKAFYNPRTRELHIHKGSTISDLRHEFVHAMMHNLFKNAKYRKRILSEMEGLIGKKKFEALVADVNSRYVDENGNLLPQRIRDEEVFALFMEQYGTQDGLNQLRKRGVLQKLKDLFNDLFNKSYGRYADEYLINTDSELLDFMEAFVAGQEVGSAIRIQEQTEADAETSALDAKSRAYPDLDGKVIRFKVRFPNRWGEFRGVPQERTLKVKDYWHWRNYWALQTGNGKHDWIFDAQYTGDDGKVKKINTPNPKKGRDGEVIDMEPKLFSFTQREIRSQLAYQKASLPISSDLNSLRMTRERLAENNAELSQAEIERMSELNQGLRELNDLLAKKNPDVDKYEAIRQRLMGDEPAPRETVASTQQPAVDPGIPRSTQFLMGLRVDMSNPDDVVDSLERLTPDTESSIDDDVNEDFVLDKIDVTEGTYLQDSWKARGKKTKSLKSHAGKPIILVQYDKSDTSTGPGYDVAGAVSSHATMAQALDMQKKFARVAKRQAMEEGRSDVTVVVGFSVQADSLLSNPRAVDEIVDHYNNLNDEQKTIFLNKFGEVLGEKLTEGISLSGGEITFKDESSKGKNKASKPLYNLIRQLYRGANAPANIKNMTGVRANFKNFGEETVAWPDFAGIATHPNRDQTFIQFISEMKEGLSIRGNNSIISALFSSSGAGNEFGMTSSEIKTKLESDGLAPVRTADIVGFTEIPVRVSNFDRQDLAVLETALAVVEVEGAPFDQALMSSGGSEFFGLPVSLPYDVTGGDVDVKSVAAKLGRERISVREAQELLDNEQALLNAVPVEKKPGARKGQRGELTYDEAQSELSALKEELSEAEGTAPSGVVSKIRANILGLENALKAHARKVKDLQDPKRGIPASLALVRQNINVGMVPLDYTDPAKIESEEILDSREAADSVTNNSWSPRERSALQQKLDWVRVKFQDKFAPIMMMQEDIEAARGSRVEGDQNFKRAEELMYGKAHNDLEKLESKVDRLKKAMSDGGVNPDMLNDFLYARHAAERNAMLKERDGVENGSGMTDQEAADVLASFSEEQRTALEKAAAVADEISQDTRDSMREFGLEADKRIDVFEDMFENYVPLGGFAQDSKDADNYPYPTGGVGFNVKGSTVKKAKGRKTPPANILAQIIQQNAAIKIKGRRNEALQSLFNLVTANPNTALWNTSDNIPVNDPDRAVGVRINGEQKFLIFKDASLAKNLKGMGVQKLDALSRVMAKPANFLRAAFTTRNPEFIISNFSRDIMSAIPNALAEADLPDGAIKNKRAVARKIISRTPQTLKALIKGEVLGKDLDPIVAKYLSEFKEDGGQTGWGFVKPLEQIAAELNNESDEGSKAKKAIKWMEKNSLQHIENMNDAFENSIRLSAYIEAREAGVSREDAAQLAKNITVNFNKSGEYGAVANAYYLFFNASIQGTSRIMRSLANMKQVENPDGSISKQLSGPQRIVIGLGLTSGMLAMINMALSDEDEDGELFYNKIPDYEKERNLIMMYDGKNYIKIPLPYGYNLFSNLGTALAETMAGQRDTEDAMWFVANSAFSSFSPVSFGQSDNFAKYLAKGVAPTTLKPLVEIAVNETYFGSKVHQTQFPVGAKRPESELAFRSPRVMKQFFQWMNSATGGSEMVSGSVDLNPDLFWYPFEYYIGGLGQFSIRTAETAYSIEEMIRTGEKPKLDANDIPFLRKVYGEPSKYYDFDLYDSNKEQVLQLYKERKSADDKSIDRYSGIVKLDKKIKQVEKKLKVLRKERRAAQSLPYIERVNRSAELQEKERLLIMEYNALHEKLRGN